MTVHEPSAVGVTVKIARGPMAELGLVEMMPLQLDSESWLIACVYEDSRALKELLDPSVVNVSEAGVAVNAPAVGTAVGVGVAPGVGLDVGLLVGVCVGRGTGVAPVGAGVGLPLNAGAGVPVGCGTAPAGAWFGAIIPEDEAPPHPLTEMTIAASRILMRHMTAARRSWRKIKDQPCVKRCGLGSYHHMTRGKATHMRQVMRDDAVERL